MKKKKKFYIRTDRKSALKFTQDPCGFDTNVFSSSVGYVGNPPTIKSSEDNGVTFFANQLDHQTHTIISNGAIQSGFINLNNPLQKNKFIVEN